MALRQAQGRLPIHRLRKCLGGRAEGLVKGVIELGDESWGLGFFAGFRLLVVGLGSGVWGLAAVVRLAWAWLRTGFFGKAQDGGLLGAFAVASVEEDLGGGDAVVLVGVVAALRDVVHQVDQVATVVGTREYLVGESLRRGGFGLLGCLIHGYSGIMIGHICIVVKGLSEWTWCWLTGLVFRDFRFLDSASLRSE